MKLRFKQRLFSWFDSYDINYENGSCAYKVKGQLAWGHCFKIFDAHGNEVGMVRQKIIALLPKFEIYMNGNYQGYIRRQLSLFIPRYDIDFMGWHVSGGIMEWNYTIHNQSNQIVAEISKKLFNLTDTYEIDVRNDNDALSALMFVLAIDAEKCSRN